MTNDHSIFAWDYGSGSALAEHLIYFRDCGNVIRMEPKEYRQIIEENIPADTNSNEQPTCSVTIAGIQIELPVTQLRDLNFFKATLGCKNVDGPIRILLARIKSKYYQCDRYPGDREPLQFQQLFLAYNEKNRRAETLFKLLTAASHSTVLFQSIPTPGIQP